MPTTVVKTIRASGGDYTTLTAWEAANQGDLVTADEVRVAECYNDWPSGLVDNVAIAGSTTDATRYMKITVAAGHRHTGVPQSGFYIKKSLNWTGLLVATDANFRAEYLDIWSPSDKGIAYAVNNALLTSCIGRGGYRVFFDIKSGLLRNCLGYLTPIGFEFLNWSSPRIYNCVAAGCTTGFSSSTGGTDRILSNCVSYSNTTNYAGVWSGSSSNNASSGTDAPGSSPINSITSAAFVNAAGNDFHLAAGSALIGAGTNLYSVFTVDIDGDAWPSSGAWDIGFDSYAASAAPGLAAAAQAQAAAAGALTHSVPLAAAGLAVATSSGAVSVGIPLAGAAAAQSGAPGTLSVTGNAGLTGAATATANASGGLALSIPLSAAAVSQALAAAGIAHGVPLAGAAQAQSGAAAALMLNVSLAGTAIARAAASAGLATAPASALAGSAAAQASASGAVSHGVPLSGAALTLSSAAANLTQIVPLSGGSAAASAAAGGLDVSVRLEAAALVAALAQAGLDVTGGMTTDGAAEASASGTLTLRVNLDGEALSQAVATGLLTADGLIVAGTPGWVVSSPDRAWSVDQAVRDWRIAAPTRDWRIAS